LPRGGSTGDRGNLQVRIALNIGMTGDDAMNDDEKSREAALRPDPQAFQKAMRMQCSRVDLTPW
jgi:hypothetical protein